MQEDPNLGGDKPLYDDPFGDYEPGMPADIARYDH